MKKLEVKHVSKAFDGRPVLQDISIELNRGELVCLLGEGRSRSFWSI